MVRNTAIAGASRPDVFAYHDYRAFLKDWFEFLKVSRPGFSVRALARQADLANGYLPMVLAGTRTLSSKAWMKLAPYMALSPSERSYFQSLQVLSETDSSVTRLEAFDKIQRFRAYRTNNPKETETYQYLTRWFYVAIREMAALSEFRADAEWIQKKLRVRIPLQEIKHALQFLTKNGYLEVAENGSASLPQKNIECTGGVYRIALGKFHREMLGLAAESIENAHREERNITGHTLAIPQDKYPEVVKVLDEALQKIAALGVEKAPCDTVYHVILSAFPLTATKKGGKSDEIS